MNAGLIKGSMTTIRNNVTAISYDDLLAMRDTIKQELHNRKPVKAPCGKRGRPSIYNSLDERKQAIDAKRKAKLSERNVLLALEGKPIPKRGRPKKELDLCDIMCN